MLVFEVDRLEPVVMSRGTSVPGVGVKKLGTGTTRICTCLAIL